MIALCRLCATFTEPSELETMICELESKLTVCCGWKQSQMEIQMPQKACNSCVEDLQRSWNFVERIQAAEAQLIKMLSEKTISNEFEELDNSDVKGDFITAQPYPDSFDAIDSKCITDDDKVGFEVPFDSDADDADITINDINVFGEPVNYLETNIMQKKSTKSNRHRKEQKIDPFLSKLITEDFLNDGTISSNGVEKLTKLFPKMKTLSWDDCQYKCNKCHRILKGAQILYAHVRSIHMNELMSTKISCFYCNFEHRREYIVNHHIASEHFIHLKYLCPHCPNKYYWNSRELINHRNSHTNLRYKCEICEQVFNNREAFYSHSVKQHAKKYVNHADDDFICDICSKRFKTKWGVRNHLLLHTKRYDFICDQCGRNFKAKGNLKQHLASFHSTEKPFKCDHCHKGFKTRHQLKNHSVIHEAIYKFACTVCGRKFRRTDSLGVHMRSHSDLPGPYTCRYCGKKFRHNITLQTHERAHTNDKPYKCTHCEYCTTSKGNLNKHMMRAHSIDFRNHVVQQTN